MSARALSFAVGPGCCSICIGWAGGGGKQPLPHKKVILLHIMNVASAQSEGQPSFVYNGQESTVFQMRRMQNRLPSKYWNHLWAVCVINSPHKSGAAKKECSNGAFWCSLTCRNMVVYCTAAYLSSTHIYNIIFFFSRLNCRATKAKRKRKVGGDEFWSNV